MIQGHAGWPDGRSLGVLRDPERCYRHHGREGDWNPILGWLTVLAVYGHDQAVAVAGRASFRRKTL